MRMKRWSEGKTVSILGLFILSVIVRGVIGDFPKIISIYPDELRYIDIARSIANGNGITLHNLASNYQKILYCLIIIPAFFFHSCEMRIRAITWINSIVMSSSIFPLYGIAKKVLKDSKWINAVLVVWMFFPTMISAVFFMSEVVFFPLSLCFVYVFLDILKTKKFNKRVLKNILLGFLCYVLYLNKEIALYYLLAYLIVRVVHIYYRKDDVKEELICILSMIGTFLLCFIMAKLTLFMGMGNSYDQMGLKDILSKEKISYLIYSVFYNVLFMILAFGVYPVLLPMVLLDKEDESQVQFTLFLLLSVLIGCGAIAYTITVREDFGLRSPRQHIRYLEPLALPFFIQMLHRLTSIEMKYFAKKLYFYLGGFLIIFIGGAQKIGSGPIVDNSCLKFFEMLTKITQISTLVFTEEDKLLWIRELIAIIIGGGALVLVRKKHLFTRVLIIVYVIINIVNSAFVYNTGVKTYKCDKEKIEEIDTMNEYFSAISSDENILMITKNGFNDNRIFDTYFDKGVYVTTDFLLYEMDYMQDGVVDLKSEKIKSEFPFDLYLDLEEVSYIIANEKIKFTDGSLEEICKFTQNGFILYKNLYPDRLQFRTCFPVNIGEKKYITNKDDIFFSQCKIGDGRYISQSEDQLIIYGLKDILQKGTYHITINYEYIGQDTESGIIGKVDFGNSTISLASKEIREDSGRIELSNIRVSQVVEEAEIRMLSYQAGIEFLD